MDIALRPETRKLLEDRLKGGRYATADELVRAALQALNQIDAQGLDEPILDAIDLSEDLIERGEMRDWKDVRQHFRDKFLGK
jgi:Arc/MetJ-type ribon-helix-helix transcriptional regulator